MAVFPLFIDLKGKKIVIIGAGNVAARKIEILTRYNACIYVIGLEIHSDIQEYENKKQIKVFNRKYSNSDIDEAFLVIAATSNRLMNEDIYDYAINKNIWINVVDNPKLCTFVFPSIVKRGDLVIGISTSGSCPTFSKKMREKLEGIIPTYYDNILSIMKDYRATVEMEFDCQEKRKKILNNLMDLVIDNTENTTYEELVKILKTYYDNYKKSNC